MSSIGMNLINIVSGWKNFVFEDAEVEILATQRAFKCSGCEYAIEGRFETIKDGRIESISGMVCNGCPTKIKCPLSAKLRSPGEKCPKDKW